MEGLDIFNKHVEWQDENNILTKVVLRDAPVEFTEEMIHDEMDKYGKIMRVEREMIRADGRDTQWPNGTWHVFMATVYINIPGKITMEKDNNYSQFQHGTRDRPISVLMMTIIKPIVWNVVNQDIILRITLMKLKFVSRVKVHNMLKRLSKQWWDPGKWEYLLIGERQEAQILKFNAPPLHTEFVMSIL